MAYKLTPRIALRGSYRDATHTLLITVSFYFAIELWECLHISHEDIVFSAHNFSFGDARVSTLRGSFMLGMVPQGRQYL